MDPIIVYTIAVATVTGFLVGACLGSGLQCYVSRKKTGEAWSAGRSHCDSCGHVLSIIDLLPIFGYLLNRGKCRYCGEAIPFDCLKVEVLAGLLCGIMAFAIADPSTSMAAKIIISVITVLSFVKFIVDNTRVREGEANVG